jgi:hypothetical protein
MDTKELRRGNWVLFEDNGTEFEVEQIFANGLDVRNSREATYIESEYFAGIPLTEEWLLRFGFEYKDNDGEPVLNHKNFGIDYYEFTDYGQWFVIMIKQSYVEIEIKYIHELQNLYFAVTHQELTIKGLV